MLSDSGGAEILRYTAATITGDWEVNAFLRGNGFSTPVAGTKLTATFAADGSLSGSAGCNRYTATYTADAGKLTITPPASTKKFCSEPADVMAQEAAFLAALPTATSYQLSGKTLDLLRDDGTRAGPIYPGGPLGREGHPPPRGGPRGGHVGATFRRDPPPHPQEGRGWGLFGPRDSASP